MVQRNRIRRGWTYGVVALAAALVVSAFAVPMDVTDPDICIVEWSGSDATLSWLDDGGFHVIRRNGKWLARGGTGVSSYVDENAPAGATYVVRTWVSGVSSDRSCTEGAPVTTTTTTTPPPPADGCVATRSGSTVTLNWVDEGGNHVIRRNDKWLATPGPGSSSFVDSSAPAGATYVVRTWGGGTSTDTACYEGDPPPPPPPPPPGTGTELVVHVSIDALRPDHVTPALMPNLTRLINEGASTMNARTDPAVTRTLPNHTSQLTGRSVLGASGHQVQFNEDAGTTVHQEAGYYVASAFDVVHDNGGRTLLYAGKSKFDMLDRNWNGTNGAPDTTGANDGKDKIDDYRLTDPNNAATVFINELATSTDLEYVLFHIRYPDSAGHQYGWVSPEYQDAVEASDDVLGRLITAIEGDPDWATTTSVIVVADHGGPAGQLLHGDPTLAENYTIPFVVWGPGVRAGADLYALNAGNRVEPGTSQPPLTGTQPIRGHEAGNLALELLGYGPVPGSVFNYQQDLNYD
jgi:hypothetical protein